MEALLLTLDALVTVWLLLAVRRCDKGTRADLGFFSYIEEKSPRPKQGQDAHRSGAPDA